MLAINSRFIPLAHISENRSLVANEGIHFFKNKEGMEIVTWFFI